MAIRFNGIKSMLSARPWLKRTVERLSRTPQAKPSLPANGTMPPNGLNRAITVEPYRPPLKELQEESLQVMREKHPGWYLTFMDHTEEEGALRAPISKLKTHEDADCRRRAAFHLGALGDKRAYKALMRAFKEDKEDDVREAAAYALGGIGDPRASRALSAALASTSREVRIAAATALGRIGGEKIFQMLMRKSKHKDWAVREAAVYGLGVLGDERAFTDILMRLGEDDYWGVREMAAKALGRMNNGFAVAPLAHAMRDEDGSVRLAAEDALIRLTDERGFDTLLKQIREEDDYRVSWAVVEALSRMGGQRAFGVLLECMKSDSEQTRMVTAHALGRMRETWAAPDLEKKMEDLKLSARAKEMVLGSVRKRRHLSGTNPVFEIELTANEARHLALNRVNPIRENDFDYSTFPASIINGRKENRAVRFDDPRASYVFVELDQEKDRDVIQAIYPKWRLESDLEVLQANAEALKELQREYLEQYPGIVKLAQAANYATEVVSDYRKLARAIKNTRILIGMAQRGLEYYA